MWRGAVDDGGRDVDGEESLWCSCSDGREKSNVNTIHKY